MAARALKIGVFANIERFKKSMKTASGILKGFAGGVARMSVKVAKIGGAMAIGAVGAGAAILAYTDKIANVGAELDKLSKRSGLTVETLEAMKKVANEAGGEFDTFNEVYKTFIERFVEAGEEKGVGTFTEDFKRAEIEIRNADGTMKDAEKTFFELTEKMRTAADAGKNLAAVEILLATDGTELKDILTSLDEPLENVINRYKETGMWTKESAKQSREYLKTMKQIRQIVASVAVAIGQEMLPFMKKAVDATKEWMKANQDVVKGEIKNWAEKIKVVIVDAYDAVEKWYKDDGLEKWFARIGAAAKGLKVILQVGTEVVPGIFDQFQGYMKTAVAFYARELGDVLITSVNEDEVDFGKMLINNASVLDTEVRRHVKSAKDSYNEFSNTLREAGTAGDNLKDVLNGVGKADRIAARIAREKEESLQRQLRWEKELTAEVHKRVEFHQKAIKDREAALLRELKALPELDFTALNLEGLGEEIGTKFGEFFSEDGISIGKNILDPLDENISDTFKPDKVTESAVGTFGTIERSVLSLSGLRQMNKQVQKVESEQIDETNTILREIQEQQLVPAVMGV